MSTPSSGAGPALKSRIFLVLLLAAVLFINYADRGLLSMASPLIQAELHLSDPQLGMLFSAFFWTYALVQIPVGWAAERHGARRVLVCGLVLWALATMLVGAVAGLASLVALRMLLGLGESVGFPCVAKLIADGVPVSHLGVANGVVGCAYSFGPAVGSALGGAIMIHVGWRSAFFVFGAASLLWLWPWLRTTAPGTAQASARVSAETPAVGAAAGLAAGPGSDAPSMARLLRSRAVWGTTIGLFCANYVFYFMMSWLPIYLVRERGFSMAETASITSTSYVVMGLFSLVGGAGVDLFIKRGGSANTGYKGIMAVVHIGAVVCMLTMAYGSGPLALASIFVYQALNGASSPGLYAMPEILGGHRATGRWVGIQNSGGSFAGVVAPWLSGIIVSLTGHFTLAFVVAAGMSFLGLVGWIGMIPRLRELEWGEGKAGSVLAVPAATGG